MRINKPVINNEVIIPPGQTLVTKTDKKGVINYINNAFIDVSGFSEDELKGKQHNVIRHPDVPSEAFRDLWDTIQCGKTWSAPVKNRCKDGSYYWVMSNVSPIYDDHGNITEYVSVRRGLSEQEKKDALALYKQIKDGEVKLHNGRVIKNIFSKIKEKVFSINVGFKIGFSVLCAIIISVILGYMVISEKNNLLDNVEIQQTEIRELNSIRKALRSSSVPDITRSSNLQIDSALKTLDKLIPKLEKTVLNNKQEIKSSKLQILVLVGIVILFILVSSIMLIKHISFSLNSIITNLAEIAQGNFFTRITYKGDDELGQVLCALKKMQIVLGYDIDRAQQLANINARIKVALDSVDSPVVLANRDNKVIYLNQSAQSLFDTRESMIKEELPEFNSAHILNNQMDLFGDPETNKSRILALNSTETQMIEIGKLTFKVVISPVISEDGERLGSVAEWIDMTQQLAIESEIDAVVNKVVAGDLSNTISLEGKDGFLRNLSEGVNSIIYVVDNALKDVENSLSLLSSGDLTHKVDKDYSGIYAVLIDNINITVDKLYGVVSEILTSSGHIDNSSKEIESGNKDMSARTEQQASNLEETASSMEELTSIVKNNAENATQAQSISHNANIAAEKGGEIIVNAIQAMEEINKSSTKISDIIGVIDEIAFQTNLLALNASVEAARAGEQGRGFAVVASEVRNLAQRSATAAKEIKELIIDSVGKVQNGSELVNQSGETLNNIVESTQKAGTLITEIASASKEQAQGIEQVNEAIAQMESITQQNASLAEQTSAASMNLAAQADTLNEMINFFKIKH